MPGLDRSRLWYSGMYKMGPTGPCLVYACRPPHTELIFPKDVVEVSPPPCGSCTTLAGSVDRGPGVHQRKALFNRVLVCWLKSNQLGEVLKLQTNDSQMCIVRKMDSVGQQRSTAVRDALPTVTSSLPATRIIHVQLVVGELLFITSISKLGALGMLIQPHIFQLQIRLLWPGARLLCRRHLCLWV